MKLEDGNQNVPKNISRESMHPDSVCCHSTTPRNTSFAEIYPLNVSFMTQMIKYSMCAKLAGLQTN